MEKGYTVDISRFFRGLSLLAIVALLCAASVSFAQKAVSIPEEIEWTWEVRPAQVDPHLPNVLLLGDSISRNYFPQVTKDLAGVANVYLMSSSTSVGDPRLPQQIAEFAKLENVPFAVVHFNNGMHGWGYTEEQYKAAFPSFLKAVQLILSKDGKLGGDGKISRQVAKPLSGSLIWASTTPVRSDASGGATNERVEARNAIALEFVRKANIAVDDQHALMMKHGDLYQDAVHFNPEGANLQGDQAAAMIRAALSGATN